MKQLRALCSKYKHILCFFFVNLLLLLMAFGGFFREGFSGDAISQKIWPLTNIEKWVVSGRFLAYLLMMFLHRLGINAVYHYKVFYLLFIMNCSIALTVLQQFFIPLLSDSTESSSLQRKTEEGFLRIILSLIFINGLFCENFMFPECFLTFSLSYLLCSLGIAFYLQNHKFISGLFVIAGALFYQAPVVPTAIIIVSAILLRQKSIVPNRQSLVSSACVLVFCICVILGSTRVGAWVHQLYPLQGVDALEVAFGSISGTAANLIQAILLFCRSGFGLLPPVFLPGICLILPCILGGLHMHHSGHKSTFLLIITMTIVFYGFSFVIVANGNAANLTGRLLGGLYTTQAVMLCIAYHRIPILTARRILLVFGTVYVVLQIVFCNMIMMNHYISNAMDLTYAEEVYQQIQKYEADTGRTVTKLAYTRDSRCEDSYDRVYYKFGEINRRCIHSNGWILVSYVSQADGRAFDRLEMDGRIYQEYFADRNWDSFLPQEQLVFVDDTVYWCVY